jgi:DNA-binding NtrC family response regulator
MTVTSEFASPATEPGGGRRERTLGETRPLEVLVVDDEEGIRVWLEEVLREAGHRVTSAADGAEALALALARTFDVIVTDIRLPRMDGMSLFRRIRQDSPMCEVILMTAYATVSDAISALREGAYEYLIKPLNSEELLVHLMRISERRALRQELDEARAQLAGRAMGPPAIIGRSALMVHLAERISTIAQSDAPVLIVGESGTGKELVARTLHVRSSRRQGPFVAVNCAAFPETLLEAELFGHERGAFTGAVKKRDGRFRAASGGTLLLDEVAEMPASAQAKLLRVLQEGVVEPLGTNTPVRVDVRLISATHRNLKERIAAGLFREDLYYRLNVLDVAIPPLRERRADLPLLLEYFLRRFTPKGQTPVSISPRAWAAFSSYPFPGNVREFAHAIEHAVVLARGHEIEVQHLPADIVAYGACDPGSGGSRSETAAELSPLAVALKEFEREYLLRALRRTGGKRLRAAQLLGISRKSLWDKLRAHGIRDLDREDE